MTGLYGGMQTSGMKVITFIGHNELHFYNGATHETVFLFIASRPLDVRGLCQIDKCVIGFFFLLIFLSFFFKPQTFC